MANFFGNERDANAIEVMREINSRHPGFGHAVKADTAFTCAHRGERSKFNSSWDVYRNTLRLMWSSDAFLAQVIYRGRTWLQARRIPILPRIAHHLSIAIAQIAIGDPVVIGPGVYIAHGQVVIDGITEIRSGAIIAPFTSIGLRAGSFIGPTIEENVTVGTGSRLLGEFTIGRGASIGANAVITGDVAPYTIVGGVPARQIGTIEPEDDAA